MKKLSCLVVSLCLFLCSCANIGAKTATLEKNREIPENGIISADVFELLKENNSIGVFSGESGSVKYKWTVFGSNIKTAADCNLKVDISGETESSVTFEIPKDSCADYQPQLSLYLNRSWGCESAEITAESGEKTTASVTEDKNTVILTVNSSKATPNAPDEYIRLEGLDESACYRCKGTDKCFGGDYLMNVGWYFVNNSENKSSIIILKKEN